MTAIDIPLWPKQSQALYAPAQEKLYGGAAGPGKSYLARAVAITLCAAVPGLQLFLFRRTYNDLYLSHYVGVNNFHEMLVDPIKDKAVEIANLEIRFLHPDDKISRIHGCHLQHEKNVYDYKSSEMHAVIFEEATEFTPFQLQYIGTRLRYPEELEARIPDWIKPMLPLALYPTNFDDAGGSKEYLCELFRVYDHWKSDKRYEISEVFTTKSKGDEQGKTRVFIPAVLDDNPSINKKRYIASLAQLRHPAMVKALIDGDPTVQIGTLWPELSRVKHMLDEHVEPPLHLTAINAHDWGSAAPAATVWAVISDGELVCMVDGKKRIMPRGAVYIYKVWLVAEPGDKTKGLGLSNAQLAEGIYTREPQHGIPYLSDTLPFQERGGIPMYEEYSAAGVQLQKADVSSKEVSAQAVRSLLVGRDNVPDLYISPECEDVFRTMALMRPDKKKAEKPDDHPEDHIPDCVLHIARAWKHVSDSKKTSERRIKEQIRQELTKKESLLDVDEGIKMIFHED